MKVGEGVVPNELEGAESLPSGGNQENHGSVTGAIGVKWAALTGPFIGGSPMSPVDFKKWQGHVSLFHSFPYHRSNSRKGYTHVTLHVFQIPMSDVIKAC